MGTRHGWIWATIATLAACDGTSKDDDTDVVSEDDTDVVDTDIEDTDVPANTAPTVTTDAVVVALAGNAVALLAAGDDADGDALTYTWALVDGPSTPDLAPGADVSASQEDGAMFLAHYAGTYTFSVTASDGVDDSALATIEVQVHDVEGGADHAIALKPDGSLWGWGYNELGHLGNGSTDNATAPVRVCDSDADTNDCATDPFTDVVQIALGRDHVLALRSDGTVWGWGTNGSLELGRAYEDVDWRALPIQICANGLDETPCTTPLEHVVAVAAGYDHSVALLADGTVMTWGSNYDGELGWGIIGGAHAAPSPACEVGYDDVTACSLAGGTALADVTRIAAGGDGHTLALSGDRLHAWGTNKNGQCGVGEIAQDHGVPSIVCAPGEGTTCDDYLDEIYAFDAWSSHSLAIRADGSAWGWGSSEYNQLSTAETSFELCQSPPCFANPVRVCASEDVPCTDPLDEVAQVVAARRFSLALGLDGRVWTWGYNANASLGHGTDDIEERSIAPVCAVGDDACTADLDGVVGIAAGNYTSYALLADGSLVAWGYNSVGQTGTGDVGNLLVPEVVVGY